MNLTLNSSYFCRELQWGEVMSGELLFKKKKGGESVGNGLERRPCSHGITLTLSQLIILFVSGSKYPVEEDQLFIPESIYQTNAHTHPHKQTPTMPVWNRRILSWADRQLMFTVQCPLCKTADSWGLADTKSLCVDAVIWSAVKPAHLSAKDAQ